MQDLKIAREAFRETDYKFGVAMLLAVPFNATAVSSAMMKYCERADSFWLRIPSVQRRA
jgi:hypothetical protein